MVNFKKVDMLSGKFVPSLILFAIPMIATNMIQNMFTTINMVFVGATDGTQALAAVGVVLTPHSLIINLFIGMAAGISVVAAQHFGAGERVELKNTVHTTAALGIIFGVAGALIGIIFAPAILKAMGTPDDIMASSVLYFRILLLGVPGITIYNFGSAILRATGDTRRPFIFLLISICSHIVFSVILILVLRLGLVGSAISTALAQSVPAFIVWYSLFKTDAFYHFEPKKVRICKKNAMEIIKIGIPSGLQSAMYSLANMNIQSSINTFGTNYIAASSACVNAENYAYACCSGLAQSGMVFVGQNYGAGNIKRIKKIYTQGLIFTIGFIFVLGAMFIIFRYPILSLFDSNPVVLKIAADRFLVYMGLYFFVGIYEYSMGVVRGMGYSLMPMLSAVFGICIFRIIWNYTVFSAVGTFTSLLLVYPFSWAITSLFEIILFVVYYKKVVKNHS